MPNAQPLKDIKVVEICHSVAGPFAGAILAELGASVLKVENPSTGDHARGWGPPYWHDTASAFQSLNRDKRSITADLRNPSDMEALKRLIIDEADVVVQNIRPGALDDTELAASRLLEQKPTLIYCNLGAFGAVGPLAQRPGYDPLMQAFGGLMSITGEPGGGPVRVGPAVVDLGTGMWAAIGILAALHQRTASGRGCVVDTSLLETAIAWLTIQVAGYLASGEVREPMGSGIAEIVPHQAFKARDGHIMVAAGNDSLFGKLCNALGNPQWASDPQFCRNDGRVRNRSTLIPLLEAVFAEEPKDVWAERLDRHGIPNAPIQRIDQVVAHPQTKALGIIQSAPDRDMALVGLPISFDGERPPYRGSAPTLGEANHELLINGSLMQDSGENESLFPTIATNKKAGS